MPNNSTGLSNPWCRLQLLWFLHWISPTALQERVCVLWAHPAPPVGLIQPKTAPALLFPQYLWLGCHLPLFISPFSLGSQHSPFLTLCDLLSHLAQFDVACLENIKLKIFNCPHLLPFPVFSHLYLWASYHIIQIFHCSFHCFLVKLVELYIRNLHRKK